MRVVSKQAVQRLVGYLEEDHKGKVLYGGKYNIDKLYIEPTLIENPHSNCKMMKEEIFGPILPIFSWDNLNTVISEQQKKEKPLSIYYFGYQKKHIERIQNETSSGQFLINDVLSQFINFHVPFGGVGSSGMSAYHGK